MNDSSLPAYSIPLLLFMCFFIAFTDCVDDPAAYITGDVSIDCGSAAVSAAHDGRKWAGDKHPKFSSSLQLKYAQFGDVSPKVDVYAFGVVLYELISGKDAIVKSTSFAVGTKGLIALFEEVFNNPDRIENLGTLIDPRLVDYPLESVIKLAQLARACTHENPQIRPTMRSIVVALTTLSS